MFQLVSHSMAVKNRGGGFLMQILPLTKMTEPINSNLVAFQEMSSTSLFVIKHKNLII